MGNLLSDDETNGGTLKFNEIYNKNSSDFKSYLDEKLNFIDGKVPNKNEKGIRNKLEALRAKSYAKEQKFLEKFNQEGKYKNNEGNFIYNEKDTSLNREKEKQLKEIFYGISSNGKNENEVSNSTEDGDIENKGKQSLIDCLLHESFNSTVRFLNDTELDNNILTILENLELKDIFQEKNNEKNNLNFNKLLIKIIHNENIDNNIKSAAIKYVSQINININKEVEAEIIKLGSNFIKQDRKELIKWYSELSDGYINETEETIKGKLIEIQEFLNNKRREKGKKNKKYIDINGDTNQNIKKLKTSIIQNLTGYVSLIKGSIAEILVTTILNKILSNKKMKAFITGDSPIKKDKNNEEFFSNMTESELKTKNKVNQSAHSDITLFSTTGQKYGIQVKFYSKNSFDFYGNSTYAIDNSNNLGRYIGKDVLEAFYIFTGLGLNINNDNNNDKIVNLINSYKENYKEIIEYVTKYYADFFQNRVSFFMRFEDISASDLLEDVQNNFFIINFEIIPTSIIINNMIKSLKGSKDIFKYNKFKTTKKIDNKNILSNITEELTNKSITFKGVKLNLNNLITNK